MTSSQKRNFSLTDDDNSTLYPSKRKRLDVQLSYSNPIDIDNDDEYYDENNSNENIDKKDKKSSGNDLSSYFPNNFHDLQLKEDHMRRPIWVLPNLMIYLETFSPVYQQAYDFLIAIAEPVSRPRYIHEYEMNEYSLYAAVSIGITQDQIIAVLEKLSKTYLSDSTKQFIINSTSSYGKVKLLLRENKFFVESAYPQILEMLMNDETIKQAYIPSDSKHKAFDTVTRLLYRWQKVKELNQFKMLEKKLDEIEIQEDAGEKLAREIELELEDKMEEAPRAKTAEEIAQIVEQDEEDDDYVQDGDDFRKIKLYRFEINSAMSEIVTKRCRELNYPMLEEYDFRNDAKNPTLTFDLKPSTIIRPYQEKSLSKMFSNSSARSGIIVLPCGAGKTLVGITAACTIKKSILILTINNVSVEQWKSQFLLWSNIDENRIIPFTSSHKHKIPPPTEACIVITTYSMVSSAASKESGDSKQIMDKIKKREWGLMLLDEVHVAPAETFRRVVGIVKAHCKLGLTATLVREDEKHTDLYYLIGPKHYEANWMDLANRGYLADVKCVEVWCPMTREFHQAYLDSNDAKKKLLYVMNPNKFRSCEYLINYHTQRGDKVIVFSDNLFALREYAERLSHYYICGDTKHYERTEVIEKFKNSDNVNCLFLSKVGDIALDIPNASVIIQIASHFGSRRQEAQRLGRILRAKHRSEKNPTGKNVAYFYTLVSQDTKEMYYSSKRQRFLVQQGYSFEVKDDLVKDISEDKHFKSKLPDKEAEKILLSKVLSLDDSNALTEITAGEEQMQSTARRRETNIRSISANDNIVYKRGKGGQGSTYSERHPLFKRKLVA